MIEFLLRPVMNTNSCAPALIASCTAYWISGLSTTGSISLGMALVAGRNRVPSPPTGKMALRTRALTRLSAINYLDFLDFGDGAMCHSRGGRRKAAWAG